MGGTFHVKLVLSQDFPNSPPRGFFLTKIYHPNVGPTGDICVNTLKKDWTATVTLSHVLQVVRCLLIVPFPESSLNDEAGKQFMESYDDYAKRARLLTSVHAMRKASAAATTGGGEKGAAAAGEGKEAAGGEDGEGESDEKAGAGGGGGGVLGSPNVAGLAKRKAGGAAGGNAAGGAKDAAADKRNNKKRGLKRL